MKRVFLLLIGVILLSSFISVVSADIIVNEQPKDLYNLGEVIKIPAKVTTNTGINDFLSVKLICSGIESEVHKQYIFLSPGEEQTVTIAIPLIPGFIGTTTGTCLIKPVLGSDYITTREFTISDHIEVALELEEKEFNPGDSMIIQGTAVKENGQNAQGLIDLKFAGENLKQEFLITETINQGQINLNITIPEDMAAGTYIIQALVYEKDTNNNKTNQGSAETDITVKQLPSNLEVVFEEKKATPGEDYEIRAILHDQTGEKIDSEVELKVRNSDEKLIVSEELETGEKLVLPIEYSEPAAEWVVYAEANGIETEAKFNIIEKEAVDIEIINRTILLTNIGNVPYNDTVSIKVGNDTLELDAFILVEDFQKYTLSAPDGEYDVEVVYGDEKVAQRVALTGNAISVEKVSGIGWIFSSFVWLFMILVLGFVAFTVYKKGYKKTFLGRIIPRRRHKSKKTDKDIVTASTLITPKHPAHLSLSIKGHKQNTSVICLKIKNQDNILKNKEAVDTVKEVLEKVTDIAESNKASVYENKENIFFIFAPARTKTFQNQKTALKTSENIKEILETYNKLAKYKIDFGIGLNYGTIVAKHEKHSLKFMSMGRLITDARRLASHSRSDILMSEDMNNKIRASIKSEKHETKNLKYYTLKEIKDKKAYDKKFISNFIKKLETENKESKGKNKN